MAAPEEVCVDAAIVSVSSEVDNIYALKDRQETEFKAFLD